MSGGRDWTVPTHWYDAMNTWGPSDDFYLALVMDASAALDVGCGTGSLLKRARDDGHTGDLCGVDPDPLMLDQARTDARVEWVACDAASMAWESRFDLAVMTGHAFQNLIEDEVVAASLSSIRRSLRPGGRFAFETRHPQARAWDGWNTSFEVRNADGEPVVVFYEVLDVQDDVVTLTETLAGRWWPQPQVEEGRLRFLDEDALVVALAAAGFAVESRYGGWDRRPIDATSEEIIVTARR